VHERMKSIYALNNSNVFDAYSHDSSDSGKASRSSFKVHTARAATESQNTCLIVRADWT
jgi:hypothetical protein